MTDRRRGPVDDFLAELGTAPVPPGLAAAVGRRIRDERPSRTHRPPPLLVAAAMVAATLLAGLGWVAGGPGPSPTPTPPPTAPAASVVPSSSPSPEPTTSPSSDVSPSPSAPVLGQWQITLNPGQPDVPVELQVIDRAGTLVGVAAAARALPPPPEDPHALNVGAGSDARSLTVGWTGGVCDERAELELAPDGRTLALRFAPRPGCDAVGVEFSVELHFAGPVDPARFAGSWGNDLVAVTDVQPGVVAFADPPHGFVGGTTAAGDAVILETLDGGTTWRVEGLGTGTVTDVGIGLGGVAWAGRGCADVTGSCSPGVYRLDGTLWAKAGDDWPTRASFAGADGAALFQPARAGTGGSGLAEVRLTDDGGETWSRVSNPCPGNVFTQDVSRVDASTVVVLCGSEGFTGNSFKTLYRSTDSGRTWGKLADGPYNGTGMGLDLSSDGTGWLWGVRSPLLATRDGGRTWTALELADEDVRIVQDADAWGGGAGIALVRDPDRQATLLLRTDDGTSWTELFAWPVVPGAA